MGDFEQSHDNVSAPVVSVCVQTYQQVKYISKCLDSILAQRTDFPFEIVLGEDESNDGTREICKAYQEKYPEKIRLFLRRRQDVIFIDGKPTGRYNMLENLRMARGKYIALCEGDDYWIDTEKLSKQYAYLESHPTYSGVFTDMIRVNSEGELIREDRRVPPGIDKLETYMLMQMNAIHTCTFFFKRQVLTDKVMEFIKRMPYGDMSLFLCCSMCGPIGYIPDLTSAYRVNVGVMRRLDKAEKARNGLKIRQALKMEFGRDEGLKQQYHIGKKGYYLRISEGLMARGDFVEGLKVYVIFWLSSIYRIFPPYPVVAKIGIMDHFRPIRAAIRYFKNRLLSAQTAGRTIQ